MKNLSALALLGSLALVYADGPKDNLVDNVRPIPPPGIQVSAADRAELEQGVAALGKEIDSLRGALKGKPQLDLLPDVQIYHNAVRYALTYNEFFKTNELKTAKEFIKQGLDRAKQLREGKAQWTTATGLVPRGYVSKIDGSVQPYGLVVPPSYSPAAPHKYRLDFWAHGRGETLSELSFLEQRQRDPGQFTPPNAIVLHLYGRYCNANKLAGEIDLLEAYDAVRKNYPIDENRLVIRGFSMGGAACWQFAVHYPGMWAAAAPGAGFSETPDFLKVFQSETLKPAWFEQKLWHMYDCVDYAVNLFNCPTVAYSGEKDRQKQAADMMAKALAAEGMTLTHIIGPNTEHKYEPVAKAEVSRRIDAIVELGRNPAPREVKFTTWTLRYNRSLWVVLDGMEQHWERARVDAEIAGDDTVKVTTKNVSGLTLSFEPGLCPLDNTRKPQVYIDGGKLDVPAPQTDRSWNVSFRKYGRKWVVATAADEGGLRKVHGLQGPIDDAFLDSFLMVRPTGKAANEKVGAWVQAEQAHALKHWRQQFRGEARVKDDKDITDADIAAHNLILWGDPSSNALLAKIADKLPIRWNAQSVQVGGKSFAGANHVPVMIYPNPLNPKKYVVLNSGFTFREYDYLNNARQVPKLPDYAVVDINVPVNSRWPGGIVEAGFFGERWELGAK
ncbi:MAG: prolyl oligopeptidase family serine peptidase [Verrucomicrobiota bacterium]